MHTRRYNNHVININAKLNMSSLCNHNFLVAYHRTFISNTTMMTTVNLLSYYTFLPHSSKLDYQIQLVQFQDREFSQLMN